MVRQIQSPPVYITIVSHNEEPGEIHPDYVGDRDLYLRNREHIRNLGLMLHDQGAMWNPGSDWNYLMAVAKYDTGEVTANTNGKNILKWLVEDLGFEADPHAHETQYNYADVAYLHTVLGVEPSRNVGGFLAMPPDNPQGWEQHIDGIWGWKYPDYFWKAENLWGAAVFKHAGSEIQNNYGIWKPRDRYHFTEHDDRQRLPHIGSGCITDAISKPASFDAVWRILDAISAEAVPLDGFYTVTPFVPHGFLNKDMIQEIAADIDALAPYVESGRVIWSSLTETANTWRIDYGSKPFRLAYDDLSEVSGEQGEGI